MAARRRQELPDPGKLATPPGRGAPRPSYDVAVERQPTVLAPPPINDRFPIVVGQGLSLTYLSSCMRLATSGYRQQLVDLGNELLENDPHLFSVVLKRVVSSAVGRVEFTPHKLPEDHPDREAADDLARWVEQEVHGIQGLTGTLSRLLWGIFWGLAASEIHWTKDSDGWHVEQLAYIHSRRLSYPNYQSMDLYVWDQGQVYGWDRPWGASPTNEAPFGLRIADAPGKFVVHAPKLRDDYPFRDGLLRQTAVWSVLKRVGARGAAEYLERFSKSFMDVAWSTKADGQPREATEEDIAIAQAAAAAIGPGSGSYWAHPDSVKLAPQSYDGGASSKITYQDWIAVCDSQNSKAVMGGTLGTDVGKGTGGNRSLGEVQERAEVDLEKFDAQMLAETFRRDVVAWLVRLNKPELLHVLPDVVIHVDPDPDPKTILALAKELTDMGAPVDLDRTADQVGIALVEQDDDEDGADGKKREKAPPRRSFSKAFGEFLKTLTSQDIPLDIDRLAAMLGVPIVAAKDLEKEGVRRTRMVGTGKDMPVEPDGSNDPNSPNYVQPPDPTEGGGGAATAPGATAAAPGGAKAKPGKVKAAKVATPDASQGKPGKAPKKVKSSDTDNPAALVNEALVGALMLSDRSDKGEAKAVFDMLLEDYPRNTLGWVLAGHWVGPVDVPLDEIDFDSRDSWRASHEDIGPYVKRIEDGKRKPVVLVKEPGSSKYMIVDGHHRTLAYEKLDQPVWAYVAHVHVKDGPWRELHAAQKQGSSKGSHYGEASYTTSHYPTA
jgi:phage gp29-like protein